MIRCATIGFIRHISPGYDARGTSVSPTNSLCYSTNHPRDNLGALSDRHSAASPLKPRRVVLVPFIVFYFYTFILTNPSPLNRQAASRLKSG